MKCIEDCIKGYRGSGHRVTIDADTEALGKAQASSTHHYIHYSENCLEDKSYLGQKDIDI